MYDWLDGYLLDKAGAQKDYKAEWEWHRYLVGGKMFAAVLKLETPCAGYEARPMVTLKCEPAFGELMRTQNSQSVLPGFYMNKLHWNSVYLDGDLSDDMLKMMCDMSYKLVFGGLTKKLQREIEENAAACEKE